MLRNSYFDVSFNNFADSDTSVFQSMQAATHLYVT